MSAFLEDIRRTWSKWLKARFVSDVSTAVANMTSMPAYLKLLKCMG